MYSQNAEDKIIDKSSKLIKLILAIASTIGPVIGIFFLTKEKSKGWASLIALGLILLAILYRKKIARFFALYSLIPDSLHQISETSTIRGLLPFNEQDKLYGRNGDIQHIYTKINQDSFSLGTLSGKSGCGKTSLLKSGLRKHLSHQNPTYKLIYINRPSRDFQEFEQATLEKLQEAYSAEFAPHHKLEDKKNILKTLTIRDKNKPTEPLLIAIDQFEELFIGKSSKSELVAYQSFFEYLISSLKVKVLIAIREDFFLQVQSIAPPNTDPTSRRFSYHLLNLTPLQAREILTRSNEHDASPPLEKELINKVITDLVKEGKIRPPES